jgi:hypothetical protein
MTMVAKRIPPQFDPEDELTMGEEIAPNVFLLTADEGWILLGKRTRDYLGMSAEEFVRRLKANDFTEEQREAAAMLSMMVPYDRR